MKNISGLMIYYYHVCDRKLWYFTHDLNMEQNSENVGLGKLIDEESYSRERKNILIDESINIDFLKDWKIVHEVKKSRKIEEASIWQIKYYMMVLLDKGLEIEKGIIDYPLLRRRELVYLQKSDIDYLNKTISEINCLIKSDLPPELKNKRICKNCAYYEYCYI